MEKRYLIAVALFAISAAVLAVPSIWEFYLWTTFSENSADRTKFIQNNFEIGPDCSGSVIGVEELSRDTIKQCFSNSSREQIFMDEQYEGRESITRTYRCDGVGFSGEIIYIFYATTEKYICSYKIADSWANITKFRTGDLAGFSPQPSYLTRLMIRISK